MLARLFVVALLSSSAVGEDHRAVNELLRAGDPAGAVAHIERLVAARGAAALARPERAQQPCGDAREHARKGAGYSERIL